MVTATDMTVKQQMDQAINSSRDEDGRALTKIEAFLLLQESITYTSYYNGKMSFQLAGEPWKKAVEKTFPNLSSQQTSENIFKDVIDLYVTNLMPTPHELKDFGDTLVPLLCRGEAPVLWMRDGTVSFPEKYEMLSDGSYDVAAIFTRSLEKEEDYVTFAYSDGVTRLFKKSMPEDFTAPADANNYKFVEEVPGNVLFRFTLDDKGMGGSLAALQDRVNHSILDQTAIAEMYARPFWYLLNTELPVTNPYLPAQHQQGGDDMQEQELKGAGGRVFTTSSDGPFGQLTPPTINDMIGYHDSITSKVSSSTGIPEFYFKPGAGTPPTGVALKTLSRRFNSKIGRIRDSISDQLEQLAKLMKIEKAEGDEELQIWDGTDDFLQEALDEHGEALFRMGYPFEYIAEVVTPGVDMDAYLDDGFKEDQVDPARAAQQLYIATKGKELLKVSESREMLRQAGAPLDADDELQTEEELAAAEAAKPTPDQVEAYAENPGQQAGAPAMNPVPTPPGQEQTSE